MAGEVNIDGAALDAYLYDPEGDLAREMERRAFAVEEMAKRMVRMHGTGRVYGHPPHQASAPGMPPSSDTGRLMASIGHSRDPVDPIAFQIGASVNYAGYLEFGTRRMAPRPFMRPALVAAGES